MFIGDALASGVEMAGVNSAYIRSMGYQGFRSGSGYGNTVSGISFTSGTLYLRFKLAEVKADSGNLNTAENRTITFTNNGVSNTDLQINCRLSGL